MPRITSRLILALCCLSLLLAACGGASDNAPASTGQGGPAATPDAGEQAVDPLVIVRRPWILIAFRDPATDQMAQPLVTDERGGPNGPATLQLNAGDAAIYTGCNRNRGGGRYTLDEQSISFAPGAMTKMACVDELNLQETAFLEGLRQAQGWRLTGEQLDLLGGDGQLLLSFRAGS